MSYILVRTIIRWFPSRRAGLGLVAVISTGALLRIPPGQLMISYAGISDRPYLPICAGSASQLLSLIRPMDGCID